MPTQAVNINETLVGTLVRRYYVGSGPPTIRNYIREAKNHKRVRPASTTHPIRPDLTRAPGPWSHSGSSFTNAYGLVVVKDKYGPSSYEFDGYVSAQVGATGGLTPQLSLCDGALNVARRKALASSVERITELGEALRQAKQTSKMITSFAHGFANGLDEFMEHSFSRIGRHMSAWKKLPSAYLEYCFGWAPIVDDITNGLVYLDNLRGEGLQANFTLKANKSCDGSSVGTVSGDPNGYFRWKTRSTYKGRANVSYTFHLPQWWMDEMPLVAPWSTEWNLLPYTFMLDRVLPIGEWIMSVESAQLSPFFKEGSETRSVRRRTVSSFEPLHTGFWSYDPDIIRGYSDSGFNMGRAVMNVLPNQLLHPPSFRSPLSLTNLAQGLALLTQVFQKWR